MNIGFSTSVIQRGKSGVAQYVFGLLRAFLPYTDQHRFTVFVLEDDLPLFKFLEGRMELVAVPEKYRSPVKDIMWHNAFLPQLTRLHKLDVLHVPSYRRMLWSRPCSLVATIHDLAMFHLAKKYDRARTFYGRVVARRLAHRQDAIITVSQTTARDVRNFFQLPESRLTTIHNGLDRARFRSGSQADAKRRAEAWGIRQPFFLYTARLEHPAKNHVRLIEAFNRFKAETRSSWHLTLVGSDWHGAEVIHAAVGQSPFKDAIHCTGFVPEEELPMFYQAADVFVYPSLYEGFGFPPLEAMRCGCPVLCSRAGALAEIVGDAAATANPEDINAMKAQMTRLATDEALRDHLRAAGLKHAEQFDWSRAARETLEVYDRATGAPK